MKITKLGNKSKRRITIQDIYCAGEVVKINDSLYLCIGENYVEVDIDTYDCEYEYVLVNLETGQLEAFEGSTVCGWVKEAQLGFYEDDSLEWVE